MPSLPNVLVRIGQPSRATVPGVQYIYLLILIAAYDEWVEVRQLTYFAAVVRHGGFTRAAEALHIAQPAISAQVRQLEKELGVQLLARTTRRVSLTAAGERFLERVHTILGEIDAARTEMTRHADVIVGRVRLGATPVIGGLPLVPLLARFRAAFPGVVLELRSGLVAALLDGLAHGELDVVLGPRHGKDDRFVCRPVAGEELVLITAPGLDHEITALSEVAGEPFVCLPAGSGLHDILLRHATGLGFTPRIDFETHTPASIREFVSAGLGVALVARSSTTVPGPPVRIHRLREPPPHPEIALFRSRSRTDRAARELYDLLAASSTSEPG